MNFTVFIIDKCERAIVEIIQKFESNLSLIDVLVPVRQGKR